MVAPGILPLTVVRGIAFEALILQCLDGNIKVETVSPDISGTGLYFPSGDFADSKIFTLDDVPVYYLYFNPVRASYIISETLTEGTITDFWERSTPTADDPLGQYQPHGAYIGRGGRTASENPTDLTGHTAEAQVRRTEKSQRYLIDLEPQVTDPVNGQVTLPGFTTAETLQFPLGDYQWDFVTKRTADGQRFGPYVKGSYRIIDNITKVLPA